MNTTRDRSFPSLYRGIVEDNIDPEKLGRCRVRVPSIHGDAVSSVRVLPWARPLVLSPVGKGKGSVNIPDIGDIVWVLFEGSDKRYPIYFGGSYGKGDIEVDNNILEFYIENDTKISYDREKKSYTIRVGENEIAVDREGIHLSGETIIDEVNIKKFNCKLPPSCIFRYYD